MDCSTLRYLIQTDEWSITVFRELYHRKTSYTLNAVMDGVVRENAPGIDAIADVVTITHD